ncbi:MAG: acyl-CoA dehydrogenase family protein [Gammaproteobacteria bacterium]|nr:acyl-CoA dehydrogenase family protein [Gammaproteobacteria bacterium]MDH5171870.1 acyl-CoA dehydrogenase family protein [Gammaproteobacteria bacterium]
MSDRAYSNEIGPEIAALRERLRSFINAEVIPLEPLLDAGGEAAALAMSGLKARARELGLWALGHPAEIGGGGLPFMDFVYMNEVIGRSYHGQQAVGSLSMQDSIMLHRYGTRDQKERWLGPLVDGDIYPSVGLTEPEVAGSDPTLMRTTAELDGDEWVINGHKWFTTGANVAAFTTVFCETEPERQKHAKFSSIIVPTDTPGYQVKRVVPTMGSTLGGHCEVLLNDVRVPRDNLLGARGEGFVIAQKRLGPGRIFHCMRWLGQAQRAFELMCDYAKVRYAHGSVLAEKGEIQRYVAESAAEIQAARLMTLDAARLMDAGDEARVQISLIKFWGARMLHNVIDRAIQVHGGLGVTSDTPLEHMYREARFARIYDGPDEVHRMVVARHLLKDPVGNAPW